MTDDAPIVLLICDDHRILTDALAVLVERDPQLTLAAPPVHRPEDAIALAGEHHPDVVLMDVEFKGIAMSGVEATRAIKQVSPDARVVVMTAHSDDEVLVDAVEAGAAAFLTKSESAQEVLDAVKAASDGESLIDQRTFARIVQRVAADRGARQEAAERFATLSGREMEVLTMIAEGMRNEEIAKAMSIKPITVQTHIRNLLYKLDLHSKLEAVTYAVRTGAITL